MDWNRAIQLGQFVNAAYDVNASKSPKAPDYDVLATIYANDLATDLNPQRGKNRVAMGLILQAQASGDAIVAIRGTEGIKEWVQDVKFGDTPFSRVPGAGNTEDGFTAMYESMTIGDGPGAPTVASGLPTFAWKRAVTSLTICGHSLGGALVTLLALEVAAKAPAPFNKPDVYTYASPKTGDQTFVSKYGEMVLTTFRLVDNVDLVPQAPPEKSYVHVCTPIKMKSLSLIPPKVRLQPNPYCWHIMSSYMHLMSIYSGGPVTPAIVGCGPSGLIGDLWKHLKAVLRSNKSLARDFTASLGKNTCQD
jgi:hypothetical protein